MNVCTPNKRYLTRQLLTNGNVFGLSVVTVDASGRKIYHEPFSEECHSTLWVNGPIIVVKTEELNDFLLSDIEMMLERGRSYADINDFLVSSSLYAVDGEPCTAIIF